MEQLLLATAVFLATHFVASTPLRAALVRSMGQWPYTGLYSLVAAAALGWMIWAFAGTPREALWAGERWAAYLLVPLGIVLIACGYGRNPTMVGAERLLKSDDPARGAIRITRHPIMWGLMLFSAGHILATGSSRALVFFGSFIVLAGLGTLLMDARKRSNPDFGRFAAATSNLPFVAVMQGRNRIRWAEIGWKRPLAGLAVALAILAVHP